MPGVDPDGVNIMLEKRVLTITGRSRSVAPEGHSLTHHEYRDGDYERAFTVSEAIDADNIQAELKDGVLQVTLPKVAAGAGQNDPGQGERVIPSAGSHLKIASGSWTRGAARR